jgi:glutathione S-transferase
MSQLTFFHAPQSRSSGVAVLLDELAAPYEVRLVNMTAGEQRQPAFLAVNPMGKVPAILHDGVLVTEQVALFIYLADLFPEAGLAPALRDRDRGPYLRWLAFYGSCFEPAVVDRAMKRDPAPASTSPYGDFDTMLGTLTARLRESPFIAGERLTAADILWTGALQWITAFKLVPESDEVMGYIGRIGARPSFARVKERDAQLAAKQKAAAEAR